MMLDFTKTVTIRNPFSKVYCVCNGGKGAGQLDNKIQKSRIQRSSHLWFQAQTRPKTTGNLANMRSAKST